MGNDEDSRYDAFASLLLRALCTIGDDVKGAQWSASLGFLPIMCGGGLFATAGYGYVSVPAPMRADGLWILHQSE